MTNKPNRGAGLIDRNLERRKSVRQINQSKKGQNSEGKL